MPNYDELGNILSNCVFILNQIQNIKPERKPLTKQLFDQERSTLDTSVECSVASSKASTNAPPAMNLRLHKNKFNTSFEYITPLKDSEN